VEYFAENDLLQQSHWDRLSLIAGKDKSVRSCHEFKHLPHKETRKGQNLVSVAAPQSVHFKSIIGILR